MKSHSIRPVKDNAAFQLTTINNNSAQQNNKPAPFMRWILMLLMMCQMNVHLTNPQNQITCPRKNFKFYNLKFFLRNNESFNSYNGKL